jgi:transposase-like protein
MDRGWLAARPEAGTSYEEIARELGCSPSKVSYWASKHGLSSTHTRRHATRGAIDEPLLRQLVAGRFSIREIAETLDRSATTVRHWLAKLDLETTPIRHSPAAERAAARGDAAAPPRCISITSIRRARASPSASRASPDRWTPRGLKRASAWSCARTATLKSRAVSPMFP